MLAPYIALSAIITSVAIMQGANGVLGTLLPLTMSNADFSAKAVGFVTAGYAGGYLIGCMIVPGFVRRVGHIRVFAASAALLSVCSLAFFIQVDTGLWLGLRLLMGIGMAALNTVSDSWVSGNTESNVRGRVLSLYMVANKLALAGSPLLLGLGEIAGPWFFMLASGLFSLSLVPVASMRSQSPPPPPDERMGIRQVYKIAPAGIIGCISIGFMNGATIALAPLYGARIGLEPGSVAGLVTSMQLGSLLLQWPLGWLSDRRDRRKVIIFAGASILIISMILALTPRSVMPILLLFALFGLWGGFSLSIYPICVAHASDYAKPEQMVPLCSSLLLAWASGAVVGPPIASSMVDWIGPQGLFFYSATVSALLCLFLIHRIRQRAPRPLEERDPYVNMPATSPAIATLDPRLPEDVLAEALRDLDDAPPDPDREKEDSA